MIAAKTAFRGSLFAVFYSIIFQNIENLIQWQIILIYLVLIVSTVAMFFISLWSTHITILNVKRRETTVVEEKLAQACRKLLQSTSENVNQGKDHDSLHNEVAAWASYERRIRETKEWPYNAVIMGRLILSIASSGLVYVIKLLSGNLTG